jgi:hypothetical protein
MAGVGAFAWTLGMQAQGNQFELYIAATDASGTPVTDLKPEDITMSESGMPGKVVAVERFNVPVRVTVVVDNGPDSERLLELYRNALDGLVDVLPADVETALYTSSPQPRALVRMTADRGELKKGFARIGRDSESARFTDSFVEFSQRLEQEAKEKKLNYSPALIMISTPSADSFSYQMGQQEKAMALIANSGTRVSVAMVTSKVIDAVALGDMQTGRQGTIGALLAKGTRGNFEVLSDVRTLPMLITQWGKEIAARHVKQTTQYRVRLERPAGVSGNLDPRNLDLRLTRQGLQPSVSGNGRF